MTVYPSFLLRMTASRQVPWRPGTSTWPKISQRPAIWRSFLKIRHIMCPRPPVCAAVLRLWTSTGYWGRVMHSDRLFLWQSTDRPSAMWRSEECIHMDMRCSRQPFPMTMHLWKILLPMMQKEQKNFWMMPGSWTATETVSVSWMDKKLHCSTSPIPTGAWVILQKRFRSPCQRSVSR